jgi:hypothetical protein
MLNILGWHPPWTWHGLGAPIASLVALPVALCALVLMLDGWLLHISDSQARPGPGRMLRSVIAVICGGTILAALCVIGRYWVGPNLAHWAWAWGVRWALPVMIVVIALTLSTRWAASPTQLKPVTTLPSAPGEASSGTAS